MQHVLTIHAFDVLDMVHISVAIRTYMPRSEESPILEWHSEMLMPGEGQPDAVLWLSDVLLYLVESL